jgi:PAB1-binding protein PBP1
MARTGQRHQNSESGLVHFAHNGASQVPMLAWTAVPQGAPRGSFAPMLQGFDDLGEPADQVVDGLSE